jgi:hypothetical protein
MAGFIDSAVQDIDNRLHELKEEEKRLQAAKAALLGNRRAPGRPTRTNAAGKRRPGRPRGRRGGNTRSNQALELVRSQPGITIPQIAEALKIEPNYLYRVMPKLTADNLIRRDGAGWHPVTSNSK